MSPAAQATVLILLSIVVAGANAAVWALFSRRLHKITDKLK